MSSSKSKITPLKSPKKKGSPLKLVAIIAILVLIIAGFIIAPVLASVGGSSSADFGRYGNEIIRYNQGSYFYNRVAYYNNMYRDSLSQNPEAFEFYRKNIIWQAAFNEAVSFASKKYVMKKSGFDISTSSLDKMVVESGYYSDEQGKFDAEAYSNSTNADRERIRKSLLNNLYERQHASDVIGGLYKTDGQIDFIASISPEERKISYIAVSSTDYPVELVKEQAIENAKYFQSIELSRIVLSTEKEIQDLLKSLEDGADFTEQAKLLSKDFSAIDGGTLGSKMYYDISEELGEDKADMIFALKEGEVSTAVETDYGWYLYRADSAARDGDFNDTVVLDTVRSWLNWNKGEVLDQWVSDQSDKIAANIDPNKPETFNTAAMEMGLSVKESDYFNLNWGGSPLLGSDISASQDSILQGALKSDSFYKEIFSLGLNEISAPISLGNTRIIARIIDIRESESAISTYYLKNYLMQYQDQLWSDMAMDSELLKNNFEPVYSEFFSINS